MLYELLKQNLVKVNVEAKNREEAIRATGQLMLDRGYIENNYIDAMVNMANENVNYIVITKGVAMPHARPSEGVKKICSALITLKEPIVFGHETNDPVKLLISLAATDSSSHLELMQDIANVFDDEELVEEIKKSQSEAKIIELIKEKTKEGDN